MKEKPYCLVLGGGGAKGVYHIGVWQALKEMDIPVNAFIGNSIGAIVASFLAQGADQTLLDIARSINLKSLIRLNKDQAMTDERALLEHPLPYWQGVYRNLVEKRGLDTGPMREILESSLDETQIRQRDIDFGVTTVNISDLQPREVFLEQMEPGELVNYVMASAAFPGFSNPEIAGKKYIDGGIYDNVPYTMARRRGYQRIILVDISGIGLNRRPKTEGSETIYIKNSIDMGSAFDFNPEFTEKFRQLGYLDCLRAFGELSGYRYFISRPEAAKQSNQPSEDLTALTKLASNYPEHMRHDRRWWLKTLEVCADFFHIERIALYHPDELQEKIDDKIKATCDEVDKTIEKHKLNKTAKSTKILDAFIKDIMNNRTMKKNPYFILCLIKQFNSSRTLSLIESTIRKLNPELAIIEAYIKVTTVKNAQAPVCE